VNTGILKQRERRKRRPKNKNYFIWKFKKDSYLCTSNGNEGKTKKKIR